jgi:hypothetical protein
VGDEILFIDRELENKNGNLVGTLVSRCTTGNGDHAGRPLACGSPSGWRSESKMSTSCDEQWIEWQLWPDGKRRSTQTPRSRRMLALPNVVAEFRYGNDRKSDAKAWQMWQANETAGSITAISSKTACATHKAVS